MLFQIWSALTENWPLLAAMGIVNFVVGLLIAIMVVSNYTRKLVLVGGALDTTLFKLAKIDKAIEDMDFIDYVVRGIEAKAEQDKSAYEMAAWGPPKA